MIYIYEDHMGSGFYTSYDEIDYEDLYCETCGDSDSLVGTASTVDELISLLCYDFMPCSYDYIAQFIDEVTHGAVTIPEPDLWRGRHFSPIPDPDVNGYYSCEAFDASCYNCYMDGDVAKGWCDECTVNFAAALREVNSAEVLHMEL